MTRVYAQAIEISDLAVLPTLLKQIDSEPSKIGFPGECGGGFAHAIRIGRLDLPPPQEMLQPCGNHACISSRQQISSGVCSSKSFVLPP